MASFGSGIGNQAVAPNVMQTVDVIEQRQERLERARQAQKQKRDEDIEKMEKSAFDAIKPDPNKYIDYTQKQKAEDLSHALNAGVADAVSHPRSILDIQSQINQLVQDYGRGMNDVYSQSDRLKKLDNTDPTTLDIPNQHIQTAHLGNLGNSDSFWDATTHIENPFKTWAVNYDKHEISFNAQPIMSNDKQQLFYHNLAKDIKPTHIVPTGKEGNNYTGYRTVNMDNPKSPDAQQVTSNVNAATTAGTDLWNKFLNTPENYNNPAIWKGGITPIVYAGQKIPEGMKNAGSVATSDMMNPNAQLDQEAAKKEFKAQTLKGILAHVPIKDERFTGDDNFYAHQQWLYEHGIGPASKIPLPTIYGELQNEITQLGGEASLEGKNFNDYSLQEKEIFELIGFRDKLANITDIFRASNKMIPENVREAQVIKLFESFKNKDNSYSMEDIKSFVEDWNKGKKTDNSSSSTGKKYTVVYKGKTYKGVDEKDANPYKNAGATVTPE